MLNEILQYVLLTLSIVYLTFGAHVLLKNWHQKVNRLFFVFCASLSLWALGYAFMANAPTYAEANNWRLVSAVGWSYFYAHWFYFSIEFTENRKRYVKPFLVGIYVLASLFYLETYLLDAKTLFSRTLYGWVPVYSDTLNQYLFMFYYMTLLVGALYMVYRWGIDATYLRHREQSNIICLSVIVSLILGGTTDTILPMLGFVIFPMGIIFILIGVSGIWFAIVKYKMMGITPGFIADNIVRAVETPIFILNVDHKVERLNSAALNVLDVREGEALGQPIQALLKLEEALSERMCREDRIENQELTLRCKEDTFVYYLMTSTAMVDEFGDFISKVVILNDITKMKNAEAIIQHYSENLEIEVERRTKALKSANDALQKEIAIKLANEKHAKEMLYFDELTLLPNRLYFKEKTIESLEESRRLGTKLAVLFMDIDDFKYINESLGHYIGDVLLKQMGNLLTTKLPDYCVIARNSGDEFHILVNALSDTPIRWTAETVAMEILEALKEPFVIEEKELFVSASIGISMFPDDGDEYITLVKNADSALYAAKQQGKNAVAFSTTYIKERINRMADLRHRLHRAIEHEEFDLHYQPQINLMSGRVSGVEALIRWHNPKVGSVSPAEFIPLAEENGLILPIGDWVIETAIKKIKNLRDEGYHHLTMAVNVSVNQLRQKDFAHKTKACLETYGVPASQMEFEITERVGFKGLMDTEETLYNLQQLGIGITIDDFGTDFSSFMNIKRLPVDKIKIATEFVHGTENNLKDIAIVQTMVEMSQALGLKVIAKGAETEGQVTYLKQIHCESVQGYFFHKPLCEEELKRVLNAEKDL